MEHPMTNPAAITAPPTSFPALPPLASLPPLPRDPFGIAADNTSPLSFDILCAAMEDDEEDDRDVDADDRDGDDDDDNRRVRPAANFDADRYDAGEFEPDEYDQTAFDDPYPGNAADHQPAADDRSEIHPFAGDSSRDEATDVDPSDDDSAPRRYPTCVEDFSPELVQGLLRDLILGAEHPMYYAEMSGVKFHDYARLASHPDHQQQLRELVRLMELHVFAITTRLKAAAAHHLNNMIDSWDDRFKAPRSIQIRINLGLEIMKMKLPEVGTSKQELNTSPLAEAPRNAFTVAKKDV